MSTLIVHASTIASDVTQNVFVLVSSWRLRKFSILGFFVHLSFFEKGTETFVLTPLLAEHVNESFSLVKCSLVVVEN